MDPVKLDSDKLSAINNPTRKKILYLMSERPYTITELSKILGVSIPTVKEHILKLRDAGLVRLKDDKHKWKYYELTREGELIIKSSGKGVPINVVLVLSLAVIIGLFILYLLPMFTGSPESEREPDVFDIQNDLPKTDIGIMSEGGLGNNSHPSDNETDNETKDTTEPTG